MVLGCRRIRLRPVARDDPRLPGDGLVNGVMGKIEEKRVLPVRLDEGTGLRRLAIRQEFPDRTLGQSRNPVRREIRRGLSAVCAPDVAVESLLLRKELGAAQVPLSDACRLIACRPERPR